MATTAYGIQDLNDDDELIIAQMTEEQRREYAAEWDEGVARTNRPLLVVCALICAISVAVLIVLG